jgi:hypothetical protein
MAKVLHAIGCVSTSIELEFSATKALTLLMVPLIALFLLLIIAAFVPMESLGLLDTEVEPDDVRARRLRLTAGGLVVLGLVDLDLHPSDREPSTKLLDSFEKQDEMRSKQGTVPQALDAAMDIVCNAIDGFWKATLRR